jgi:hypothetical protein
MNRYVVIKILFLFFIVAFACSGLKTALPAPPPAIEKSKPGSLSHQSQHTANSELEGVYFPAATGGHLAVQKNFAPLLNLPATSDFYNSSVAVENLQIKESSLLIKDYLSHIYPTHNFW